MDILVVDDHTLFREGLSLVLKSISENCNVHQAQTGKQSLQIVNDLINDGSDIDIILLDYNLPDYDGVKLMCDIKKIDSSLPIAILSGENHHDLILHAIDLGASGFITKNIETDAMLSAIHVILNGGIYMPDSSLLAQGELPDNKDKIVDFKVKSQTQQIHQNMQDLLKMNLELKVESALDALTGIPNRRNIDEFLDNAFESAKENKSLIAVAMIDADFFKKVNDTYGHDAGDITLQSIAKVLAANTTPCASRIGRYGGEEFIAVFNDKSQDEILNSLEKFRSALENEEINYNGQIIKITASIGVATIIPIADDQVRTVMRQADKKLYDAKLAGRNQILNGGILNV